MFTRETTVCRPDLSRIGQGSRQPALRAGSLSEVDGVPLVFSGFGPWEGPWRCQETLNSSAALCRKAE